MSMKILITSGGTTEAIDCVRGITNHSTGQLGKTVTETFLENHHHVTLITTKTALKPNPHHHLTLIIIETVSDLLKVMKEEIPKHEAIIHSMAVSDYTPVYMTDISELEKHSPEQLMSKTNSENKISSSSDYQVLFLKKTPKIISLIKKWNPSIFLIGFKLLVEVSEQELLDVAKSSLRQNKADIIVANDLSKIKDNQHHAYIVDADGQEKVNSKKAIAQKLYERITQHA